MDGSTVMDLAVDWNEVAYPPGKPWLFQPDDDAAPDLFFETEPEACAAQQGWRIARGFHPITGKKAA